MSLLGASLPIKSDYWISVFGETSATYEGVQGIGIDSSGNSYVCGYGNGPGNIGAGFLAKIDQYGKKVWQKWIQLSGYETYLQSIQVGSGGVYLVGAVYVSGIARRLHMKTDFDGAIQWQYTIGDGTTSNTHFHQKSLALDPFGNTVSVAGFGSAPTKYYMTTRLNTDGGNFNTYHKITHANNGYFDNVKIDGSTQNNYLYGDFASTGSFPEAYGLVTKLNEYGAHVWSSYYNNDSNRYSSITGLSADTTYAYAAGYEGSDSGVTPYRLRTVLTKINGSNGSTIWNAGLDGGLWRTAVHSPTSGNIYVVGSSYPDYSTLIAKYDSNGTLLWQRTMTGTSVSYGGELSLDSSENLYVQIGAITINGSSNSCIGVMKLPGDGSLTGTYGDIVYAASSLPASTLSSWASTSASLSSASGITSQNGATGVTTSTLSDYKKNIR
jgi:hypothetical protein